MHLAHEVGYCACLLNESGFLFEQGGGGAFWYLTEGTIGMRVCMYIYQYISITPHAYAGIMLKIFAVSFTREDKLKLFIHLYLKIPGQEADAFDILQIRGLSLFLSHGMISLP